MYSDGLLKLPIFTIQKNFKITIKIFRKVQNFLITDCINVFCIRIWFHRLSILILETVSPILHEMSHSLMVCRSVSMVCFFCSLMFRFTACISSSVVVDSCQPLFTIIFLDLLLVLEVSGCFSYNGMGFRLQLPFRIFLCGYSKLFSINRTIYNNISFTHLLR